MCLGRSQSILLERVCRRRCSEFKSETVNVAECECFSDTLFVGSALVATTHLLSLHGLLCCAHLFRWAAPIRARASALMTRLAPRVPALPANSLRACCRREISAS